MQQEFFITWMPPSRPADYYLKYGDGSVFIDFNNYKNDRIRLIRISFDSYGCCSLGKKAVPMNETDSQTFKEIFKTGLADQAQLTIIIRKTITDNRHLIWEDALNKHRLL